MYHDPSNGSRARAARIRSAHDYEATELEALRRRGRPAKVARLALLVGLWRAAPLEQGRLPLADR